MASTPAGPATLTAPAQFVTALDDQLACVNDVITSGTERRRFKHRTVIERGETD